MMTKVVWKNCSQNYLQKEQTWPQCRVICNTRHCPCRLIAKTALLYCRKTNTKVDTKARPRLEV